MSGSFGLGCEENERITLVTSQWGVNAEELPVASCQLLVASSYFVVAGAVGATLGPALR